ETYRPITRWSGGSRERAGAWDDDSRSASTGAARLIVEALNPIQRFVVQRFNDSNREACHTKVTLKILTLRRALRQAGKSMKCPKLAHKILATVLLAGVTATASAQIMINGAGATFPYPIYSKWFDEYAKVDPSVRFNYQSIGSGGGQKQILAQTVDFGASDGPMSDDNLGKAPGKILHIPTVAGAVVMTYNVPGSPALRLDGETIADIFLGKIKKWNDSKIAALNSGASLPDKEIVVTHRSDGSG